MTALTTELEAAFEDAGYDVVSVSENRGQVRVVLREDDVEAAAVRSLTRETVGEDRVLGLDVSTESPEDLDGVSTVISFRHRG